MLQISKIGQGTWNMPENGAALDQAVRALQRGIELGMTHVDTAEMYGSGRVEEIVGKALARFHRKEFFVTTKVLPANASYKATIAACERSLRRLNMEYVDLYLLHWPSSHPLEETMRALETLVERGKTRFIGVSNFDVDQVREAASYLRSVPLASDQVLYHLRERTAGARLIPYCGNHDIAVVAYTPFGRSRFPRREAQPEGLLGRIAAKHGKTVRQVILNFLTRPANVFAIPKASHLNHVEENAGALDLSLDAQDVAAIEAVFPVHDGPLASL